VGFPHHVYRTFRILVGISWLSASAAAAQQPSAAAYVDQPITSVVFAIEGRATTEPALTTAVQTRVGMPLKMSDVRQTIAHLYGLGRFEDVQVEAEHAPNGGVALRYELLPIHTVTKVEFRGEAGLPDGLLRSRMAERFGATPPVSRAADVAAVLQQLYYDRGFLSASVKPAPPIIAHDPDRATLVFDIAAGLRTSIARTTITGHPLESATQIERRLQVSPAEPYEPGELSTRLSEYVTWMRHRRYYEASARDVTHVVTPDRQKVDLTIEVQPGPLVAVEFAGDPLPKGKIAELVPIEREGSIDQDILEDSARRIVDYLSQQGYWKADVPPPERKETDAGVTLVFHVSRGRLYRVAPGGVEVRGNQSIPIEELRPLLRLTEGEPFISAKLGAIESALKQVYRTRGFATAELSSDANEAGDSLVKPVIVIKEGPRVVIGELRITGSQRVQADELMRTVTGKLKSGEPYYGPQIAAARDAILGLYQNLGYASADVKPQVESVAAPEGARANVVFQVVEGPQTFVEHIFITGNLRTDPGVIRHELKIREGAPLGFEDLNESRRQLSALNLFRRIQISAVSHGDPSQSDIIVTVEEGQRTTIGYGGGLQVDRILRNDETGGRARDQYEVAPRGFFEIGRRNLGGRNRSVNLYTRLSLRPNADPEDNNPFAFSEYRVVGTYREPRALRNYGDLTGTAAVEQGVRTGFNFSRKGINLELTHRLAPTVRGSARYSFGTTHIFDFSLKEDEKLTVDRVFSQVRLSTFSMAVSRDTRDDLIDPQGGTLLSADGTFAARGIGSEVGFTKTFLQGFFYKNLGRPHAVFAGGARLGLARALVRVAQGVEVRDLPASERFFVGGDTTIRGFSLDSVGAPSTITTNGFPKGGDAEIVLNGELRLPLTGPVGAALFLDGGNVFARAADLDLGHLRGSVGFGARYRSPIGPVRFDVGFKLDRRTIAGNRESRYALHFSIGQAF
jgi:outer membrane protein insertion porin family